MPGNPESEIPNLKFFRYLPTLMFLTFLKSGPALKLILALALSTGLLHAAPGGPGGMDIERTQPERSIRVGWLEVAV